MFAILNLRPWVLLCGHKPMYTASKYQGELPSRKEGAAGTEGTEGSLTAELEASFVCFSLSPAAVVVVVVIIIILVVVGGGLVGLVVVVVVVFVPCSLFLLSLVLGWESLCNTRLYSENVLGIFFEVRL